MPSSNIVYVEEPVNEWSKYKSELGDTSLFDLYYNKQSRYSFAFQIMVLHTRFEALEKAIAKSQRTGGGGIVFTERDIVSDAEIFARMLGETGKMKDVEYKLYLDVYNSYKTRLENLSSLKWKRIWLNASPDVCMMRIKVRGRKEEVGISKEYLCKVDKFHKEMIAQCPKDDLLILNGDIDTMKTPSVVQRRFEKISEFINKK